MASRSDYIYDDKGSYERAPVNRKIMSSERSNISAVQKRVVRYPKDRNGEPWCRGFLKSSEFAAQIERKTYAPMVTMPCG